MENPKGKPEADKNQNEYPTAYVIAGPNGAGKTTFANEFLPDFVDCREFLNADLIAAGLAPFAPETQNFRAGRLLLTRIKELTKTKESFGLLDGSEFPPKRVAHEKEGRLQVFHLPLFERIEKSAKEKSNEQ